MVLPIWFLVLLLVNISQAKAGICWRRQHADKTCSGFFKIVSRQEDCCSRGGVAFSNGASSTKIFFYMFIKRPPCSLCAGACSNMKCFNGWKCKVASTGVPACKCQPDCPALTGSPVCGSNGRTYASKCHFLRESCRLRRLKIDYNGPCKKFCIDVTCPKKEVCVADKNGNSYCIDARCPTTCPQTSGAVCGTDRKTYQNECSLKKASCESGRKVRAAYLGPCHNAKTCDKIRCPRHKKCVLDVSNQPRCVSCSCTLSPDGLPVCGSDGKKYNTWCHMRRASCNTGRLIIVRASEDCK